MWTIVAQLALNCTDIHNSHKKDSPSYKVLEYAGAWGTFELSIETL